LEGLKPAEELADPDSGFIEVDGLRVHYKESGQGKPAFVLLHGFGASVFSWREVRGPFSEAGRVVAYDRPGFGLTERPMPGEWNGPSPYGLEANVELLVHLMDALDIRRAVLVGNSAGGAVAAEAALRYPDRVTALVLVDPALGMSRSTLQELIQPLLASPQMRRIGPLFVRRIAGTGNDIILRAWHAPGKVSGEIISAYRRPLSVQNWDRALYEFTIAARPSDLPARMNQITAPVLILTGDDDRIVPTAATIQLAGQLPAAQLVVIPGCGHVPQEECPQPFLEAVFEFLDKKVP
jgi:pimeloyl-ACP methyl ester carboxylesterase